MTIQPSCHICGRSIHAEPKCECHEEMVSLRAKLQAVEREIKFQRENLPIYAVEYQRGLEAKLQAAEELNTELHASRTDYYNLMNAALSRAEAAEAERDEVAAFAVSQTEHCSKLQAELARLGERVEKLKKHNRTIAGFIKQRNFDIAEANRQRYAAYSDVDKLRTRIAELEAELKNHASGCHDYIERRNATEAALRWAVIGNNRIRRTESVEMFVQRGLAALLDGSGE